ncbi:MAG: UBP-type zinc finger domain-containing protein [Sphingobacteriaceae bacterium]|nr:UBP-type zinc finger domain-containing protein [Sphingobacteriaceae bacterium]
MNQSNCSHLSQLAEVTTGDAGVCEDCVKEQSDWVHLRTCQTCGITLCCDQSPQTHMTRHYYQTSHPVVASAEPGERWLWCYPDSQILEY